LGGVIPKFVGFSIVVLWVGMALGDRVDNSRSALDLTSRPKKEAPIDGPWEWRELLKKPVFLGPRDVSRRRYPAFTKDEREALFSHRPSPKEMALIELRCDEVSIPKNVFNSERLPRLACYCPGEDQNHWREEMSPFQSWAIPETDQETTCRKYKNQCYRRAGCVFTTDDWTVRLYEGYTGRKEAFAIVHPSSGLPDADGDGIEDFYDSTPNHYQPYPCGVQYQLLKSSLAGNIKRANEMEKRFTELKLWGNAADATRWIRLKEDIEHMERQYGYLWAWHACEWQRSIPEPPPQLDDPDEALRVRRLRLEKAHDFLTP
jgi:hypothetical protein